MTAPGSAALGAASPEGGALLGAAQGARAAAAIPGCSSARGSRSCCSSSATCCCPCSRWSSSRPGATTAAGASPRSPRSSTIRTSSKASSLAPDRARDRIRDAAAARPDHGLDRRPRAANAAGHRVPVPPAAGHPGHRSGRRHCPDLSMDGPEPWQSSGDRRSRSRSSTSSSSCPTPTGRSTPGMRTVDVATLSDAARSLGAGWPRTIVQVVVPNIRGGILASSVLAVALVLGEYTISSLLSFSTLQVVIFALGKRERVRGGRGLAVRPRLRLRPALLHRPLCARCRRERPRVAPEEEPAT